MEKRLGIFSIYDKQGHIDQYILFLLKELKSCLSRLIIVINGQVDEDGKKELKRFTDEIVVRENKGYDAGAYYEILLNYLSVQEIKSYEEIVLCNDTFFGPFVPMSTIFDEMEHKECDFWGLSGYTNVIFAHIQSYFLVFRKKIIEQNLLVKYFKSNIDASTDRINYVYCQFETGLFDYLTRECHMTYKIYAQERKYDVYKSSYIFLSECKLPIVKKKTFEDVDNYGKNVWCTLSYIKYNTDYDIDMVLKCIKRIYGINIHKEEIQKINKYRCPVPVSVMNPVSTELQVEEFIVDSKFYIYGGGAIAHKVYWRFARCNKNLIGFIISDNQRVIQTEIFGNPIYHFSDIDNIYDYKVILGVDNQYVSEIMNNFEDTSNVLRIF